ncbi:MAG TPA: peroxiredoxin-like family protein [Candidatus Saccharimonadales bacterium]|jgi:peroxiredoxin
MMRPEIRAGDAAPVFKTTDVLGNEVRLTEYKDGFVLLVFLRYSGCPLCNLTLHRLTLEYPMLKKSGCEVIAFVQSSAENIKKNIYDRQQLPPPYSIVADPDRQIYDQYGVSGSAKAAVKSILDIPYWLKSAFTMGYPQTKVDGDLLLVPATFLVGRQKQNITKAHYNSSFYEHKIFTDIYEDLIFS